MTNFKVGIMIRKAQSGQTPNKGMICLKINRNNVTVHSIDMKVSRTNIKVNKANPKVNKINIQSASRIYVHRHMASCVLSTSKHFQYLKITCPFAVCKGIKTRSEVGVFERICGYRLTVITAKIKRIMTIEKRKHTAGGRKPKTDPCRYRYSFNLNDDDNAKFLSLFESSGLKDKARFITSCIFKRELKVVKIDKATMDYYIRLTAFYAQFQAIGNNYNQTVRAVKTNFGEKRGLALLYKLEKTTIELAALSKEIIRLTREYEERWLQK
jgi:hypothetical protein